MRLPSNATLVERFAARLDVVRAVASNLWRLGSLMVKGAYLVGERKRLLTKLGEQALDSIQKGRIQDPELHATVQQLLRVTKKLELEEILVRNARHGVRLGRTSRDSTDETASLGDF